MNTDFWLHSHRHDGGYYHRQNEEEDGQRTAELRQRRTGHGRHDNLGLPRELVRDLQ